MQTRPGWEHCSVKRAYMRDIKNNIQNQQLKRKKSKGYKRMLSRDDPGSTPKVQSSEFFAGKYRRLHSLFGDLKNSSF